jgi:hypothetical protein
MLFFIVSSGAVLFISYVTVAGLQFALKMPVYMFNKKPLMRWKVSLGSRSGLPAD